MKVIQLTVTLSFVIFFSCESQQEVDKRMSNELQQQIEKERLNEEKLLENQAELEQAYKDQEIYDKYISNTLQTGSTPYSKYFGGNSSCTDYGCSKIIVITSNSDVIVTIKKDERVVRHAYIQAGDRYSFSFKNGIYQTFFYYGKGWNPDKVMKGGELIGGFISNEDFGKDDPQTLYNNVLTYELIMQENGNFSTRPSNPEEAL